MKQFILTICIVSSLLHSNAQDLRPHSKGEFIEHTYYSLAYSEEHEQALWVYYTLIPEMTNGNAKRHDNFRSEYNLHC